MNTKSIIISLLHLSIISSQIDSIEKHFGGNIISMYGPPGGEVTSFLNDSYGNYWIGTGSSGGIYLSNDKGNNWKPVNKNIGVSHIFEIIEKDNEIFTYLVPNDSLGLLMDEERFWGSTVKDLAKWYKYNSSDSSWNVISLSSFEYKIFNAELKRLKTMIKTEKESNYSIFNEYLNPIKKCIDKVGNYSLGFEIDHMPFPKNSIGFDVVDGEIISINPNGIYHLKNISKVKDLEYKNNTLLDILDNEKEKLKNKIIKYENYLFEEINEIKSIISKLNSKDTLTTEEEFEFKYLGDRLTDLILIQECIETNKDAAIDKYSIFHPMNMNTIIASDPRQIVPFNGNLFALIGKNNIWVYRNNKWNKILDGYVEDLIKRFNNDINEIVILDENIIGFYYNNKFFQIINDNVELLFPKSKILYDNGNYYVPGVNSIGIDSSKKIWSIIDNKYLIRLNSFNDIRPLFIDKVNKYDFFIQGNSNDLWLFKENKIHQVFNESGNLNIKKDFVKYISKNDNGDILMYYEEEDYYNKGRWKNKFYLLLWKSEFQKWLEIKIDRETYDFQHYVTSILIDNKGDIYIGTGFAPAKWNYVCGALSVNGNAGGVFLLEINANYGNVLGVNNIKPISNFINPWVISLADVSGKLYVGTSGSGIYYINLE